MKILIILTFFLLATIIGTRETKGETISQIIIGIESRCQTLTFISETDYSVHSFFINRTVSDLTKESFLRASNKPPLSYITEQAYTDFFTPIITYDESGDWEQLQIYMENRLTDMKVFRLWTSETTYDLYIVGLYPDENGNYLILGAQTSGAAT